MLISQTLHMTKTGAASPVEMVGECLQSIRLSTLNAVREISQTALDEARALEKTPGARAKPLYGLPVLIKDNIDVRGMATTAGSAALLGNRPAQDAPIVHALREAGAVVVGKTNMTELANWTADNMPGGYSSAGGQVKSPWGDGADVSGSSSGSAVAVAAGICPAAIGTDTSFSVVGCAAVNGVVGFKPARGRLSGEGIVPIARTLDSAGPMARDMDGALRLYAAMRALRYTPPAHADPRTLRIAVNEFRVADVSEAQMALYDAMMKRAQRDGVQVTRVCTPASGALKTIMCCEFARDMRNYLAHTGASCRTLEDIATFYRSHPACAPYGTQKIDESLLKNAQGIEYAQAMAERARVTTALRQQTRGVDACVMTGPTSVMHLCGFASVSLPFALGADGKPRGIILFGQDEQRLIAAALYLETLYDGAPMPPKH